MNNINLVKLKIKCNTILQIYILCKCHKIAKVSHPIIYGFHHTFPILILKIVKWNLIHWKAFQQHQQEVFSSNFFFGFFIDKMIK
jgi:hypothetical protein